MPRDDGEATARPGAGELAQSFAAFAQGLDGDAIPVEVRERAVHHILDTLGIALAAARQDWAFRALEGVRHLAPRGEVPVIGFAERLAPRDAALINGLIAHGLDFDDTHQTAIVHPTVAILPTVLSAGLASGATGREMITAYLAGVEVSCRIGAVAHGAFHAKGFHPTAMCNVFGAAVAAARLFGCTPEQIHQAQGIALSQASGALEFLEDGAWTKRMHPGWAASAGLLAASMAKAGFIGATSPYTGRYGLFNLYQDGETALDWRSATERLGERWALMDTSIKPFPACHFSHGAIDAALDLVADAPIDPDTVDRIQVLVPQEVMPVICEPDTKRRPRSAYEAQFSTFYLVAAALVRRRFSLRELEPSALADPTILDLAAKVDNAPDPESGFPKFYSAEVKVTFADGSARSARRDKNRGAADTPLTNGEIVEKFDLNAATAVSRDRAAMLKAAVLGIDGPAPISDFANALARLN